MKRPALQNKQVTNYSPGRTFTNGFLGPKSSFEKRAPGIARYCRKVRKGLPKLRWGSKKHSKESGSGVFARDSEMEREEL